MSSSPMLTWTTAATCPPWCARGSRGQRGVRKALQPWQPSFCATAPTAHSAQESMQLNEPLRPSIIISASGMATGGRVVHHLLHLLPASRHTVILTGYQAVGTRGRQLAEGATELKMFGR